MQILNGRKIYSLNPFSQLKNANEVIILTSQKFIIHITGELFFLTFLSETNASTYNFTQHFEKLGHKIDIFLQHTQLH